MGESRNLIQGDCWPLAELCSLLSVSLVKRSIVRDGVRMSSSAGSAECRKYVVLIR